MSSSCASTPTHTPVPAGNETYSREEILPVLGRIADLAGERHPVAQFRAA